MIIICVCVVCVGGVRKFLICGADVNKKTQRTSNTIQNRKKGSTNRSIIFFVDGRANDGPSCLSRRRYYISSTLSKRGSLFLPPYTATYLQKRFTPLNYYTANTTLVNPCLILAFNCRTKVRTPCWLQSLPLEHRRQRP
jgi:hypothetical protein